MVLTQKGEGGDGVQTVFDLSQGSGYFDLCPVAFLILELVQDEKGQPEDLIIRYGNPALAKIAKRPASELQGKRLFQDLIPEEPKDKWMPTYVAAALSGEDKEVHEFIGVTNRYWKVVCYPWTKKGFCACFLTDETDQVRFQKHIEYMANYDIATGAYSKNSFKELCITYHPNGSMGMVYVDINDLKMCNDVYGHQTGDLLISTVAQRIFQRIGHSGAKLYRVGRDEFVILWEDCTQEMIEQLAKDLETDFVNDLIEKMPEQLASVGCSWMKECTNIDNLVRLADQQMYEKKEQLRC